MMGPTRTDSIAALERQVASIVAASVPDLRGLSTTDGASTEPDRVGSVEPRAASSTQEIFPDQAREQVARVVDQLNQSLAMVNHRIRFRVSDSSGIQVQIVDAENGEVLKSIPPERAESIGDRLLEFSGLLVDERG